MAKQIVARSASSTDDDQLCIAVADLHKVNPLIDTNHADTLYRVKAVLRYLALVGGGPQESVLTEEDRYGLGLLLETCAAALDYPNYPEEGVAA